MSCNIYINGKKVLKTSGGVFDSLYYGFLEILDKMEPCDTEMKNFMSKMEEANEMNCCYGFDIGEFIKTSKNILLIMDLLEKTIFKIQHELKDWSLADLWNFHAELVKYKEELESHGK